LVAGTSGHGRLINPPGRSTMWRYGFNTPHNSDDHQLSCGGFGVSTSRQCTHSSSVYVLRNIHTAIMIIDLVCFHHFRNYIYIENVQCVIY